jgi:putative DNA primase/helicase
MINTTIETPEAAATRLMAVQLNNGYSLEALHTYTDPAGEPLYWRIRLRHQDNGEKIIRPMRLQNNRYELKEPQFDKGKPLYNAHTLTSQQDQKVWLVEGEKCADLLTGLGLVATTSGGAGSVSKADWSSLHNREVIIWPDNDPAGMKYAAQAYDKLTASGCNVNVIDPIALGLDSKDDCVDWYQRHDPANKEMISTALKQLPVIKDFGKHHAEADKPFFNENKVIVMLQPADTIEMEPIKWLWDGWLAKNKFHILAGSPGTGKTTIALSLAATISRGGEFPDGSDTKTGSVIIWSGEDSPEDTLAPRLKLAGADLSKVHFISEAVENSEKRAFDPAIDIEPLNDAASKIEDLALLILDPIVNAVANNSHNNGDVRRALQPLVDFAKVQKCAVLGITHFTKGTTGRDPLERVTGSLAFGAIARVVMVTAKPSDAETHKHILCRAKSNIGNDGDGFEYEFNHETLAKLDGISASKVEWGKFLKGSARELLGYVEEVDEENTDAVQSAKEFLEQILKEGAVPSKAIRKEATEVGLSWASVRRAKDNLPIKAIREDKGWLWKLNNFKLGD